MDGGTIIMNVFDSYFNHHREQHFGLGMGMKLDCCRVKTLEVGGGEEGKRGETI